MRLGTVMDVVTVTVMDVAMVMDMDVGFASAYRLWLRF